MQRGGASAVPRRVWIFLAVGLLAASQSGNIIRIGDAHPVAIAAWRLLIATALLLPITGRRLGQLKRLGRLDALLAFAAGAALAAHFFAWIAAVQMTTVAGAAVVFAVNPVITATAAWALFRDPFGLRLAISILLGLGGVAALGWDDLSFAPEHLPGDGMALLCSLLFTVYFLLGKRLRRKLDTDVYVTAVYGAAAAVSLATLLALDLPLVGYGARNWLCFALMALVPTLIGHTSFNNAVAWIPAGRITALMLSEPVLAGLVAAWAWGERPSPGLGLGYALICVSVLVLVLERRTPRPGGNGGRSS